MIRLDIFFEVSRGIYGLRCEIAPMTHAVCATRGLTFHRLSLKASTSGLYLLYILVQIVM